MIMVLFYAEELKRDVLDTIQATDRFGKVQRVPPGTKNPVDRALQALVADGAITAADKSEIVELIDYRNAIGHQVHNLLADLSADKAVRWMLTHTAAITKIPKYRYDVLPRLRHFWTKIDGLYRTHHYVRSFSHDRLLFTLADKMFLDEIKRLEKRTRSLLAARSTATDDLRAELSITGTGLEGTHHPSGPYSKYDNGRLTKLGAEICYRLFDLGKSPFAVAHLCQLSLAAARKRHASWRSLGGKERRPVDLSSLPKRKFYRRDFD